MKIYLICMQYVYIDKGVCIKRIQLLYTYAGLINIVFVQLKMHCNTGFVNVLQDYIVDVYNNIYNFHVKCVYGAGVCII